MRKKHNVQDIIRIGEDIIRKNGYHHTGINDILKASGMPKGSFYNYFNSKEAFGKRLLEHEGTQLAAKMEAMLQDASKRPLERIKSFYDVLIEEYEAEECRNGSLVGNLATELGGQVDILAETANAQYEGWVILLAECIREGQREGELTEDYTAVELAHFIHASFFGALTRGKMLRSTRPLRLTLQMTFDFITQREGVGQAAWKI